MTDCGTAGLELEMAARGGRIHTFDGGKEKEANPDQ